MGISNGGGNSFVPSDKLHEQVPRMFGIDQMVLSVERIAQALARMSPKDTAQLANLSEEKKVVAVFIAFGRRVVMRR